MAYSIKEIFYTLQGEGGNAGRPAVFCRFSGCNLWTGREKDREKAICQFCDTDFVGTDGPGGGRFKTATELAEAIEARKTALADAELEALHLGLAVVARSGGDGMEEAARALMAKIDALLPEDHAAPTQFAFAAYPFEAAARGFRHMPAFRAAIRARQKLRITLSDGTRHDLRPLELRYWGRIWACVGWSESAGDFTSFRIDQIEALAPLPGLFVEEPGKRLQDYQARPGR